MVSVDRPRWTVEPFAGVVPDGFVYGRGAIDMKGANAAFMAARLRHGSEGARFDRDIVSCPARKHLPAVDCDPTAFDLDDRSQHGGRMLEAGALGLRHR